MATSLDNDRAYQRWREDCEPFIKQALDICAEPDPRWFSFRTRIGDLLRKLELNSMNFENELAILRRFDSILSVDDSFPTSQAWALDGQRDETFLGLMLHFMKFMLCWIDGDIPKPSANGKRVAIRWMFSIERDILPMKIADGLCDTLEELNRDQRVLPESGFVIRKFGPEPDAQKFLKQHKYYKRTEKNIKDREWKKLREKLEKFNKSPIKTRKDEVEKQAEELKRLIKDAKNHTGDWVLVAEGAELYLLLLLETVMVSAPEDKMQSLKDEWDAQKQRLTGIRGNRETENTELRSAERTRQRRKKSKDCAVQ